VSVQLTKQTGHDVVADGGARAHCQLTELEAEQRLQRPLGRLFLLK
jgi:hypothetical protein